MDIIWRWAMSITLIMLSLQAVAGFGIITVQEALMVAAIITATNAGLQRIWQRVKVSYSAVIFFLLVVISNVIILYFFYAVIPLLYAVDMTSALIVVGFISIVGWTVQTIPPLSPAENHAPRRKRFFR